MEQLKAFLEKIGEDSELNTKFNDLRMENAGKDKVIALASEYGFTITEEDLDNAKKDFDSHMARAELSEEELEDVAGGGGGDTKVNCWFTEGGSRSKRITGEGLRIKCYAPLCNYFGIDWCSCLYREISCIDGYHLVCERSYDLLRKGKYNHDNKDPQNYYKTR